MRSILKRRPDRGTAENPVRQRGPRGPVPRGARGRHPSRPLRPRLGPLRAFESIRSPATRAAWTTSLGRKLTVRFGEGRCEKRPSRFRPSAVIEGLSDSFESRYALTCGEHDKASIVFEHHGSPLHASGQRAFHATGASPGGRWRQCSSDNPYRPPSGGDLRPEIMRRLSGATLLENC